MTNFTWLTSRLKNFLSGWLLVLGLKEGLIKCATVCVKSEVILMYLHWIQIPKYIVSLSIINYNQILSWYHFRQSFLVTKKKVNHFIHWCWIVYIFSVNIHWNLEKLTFSTYHWLQPITTCSDVRFVVEILTYRAACVY